jgi:hypothetical protein
MVGIRHRAGRRGYAGASGGHCRRIGLIIDRSIIDRSDPVGPDLVVGWRQCERQGAEFGRECCGVSSTESSRTRPGPVQRWLLSRVVTTGGQRSR